jgi:HEAT repeat protein
MAGRRDEVRTQLRALAKPRTVDPKLRASALIALGRLSEPADADLFLAILLQAAEPDNVQQAAALGLGLVPPLEDDEARQKVRRAVFEILDGKRDRPPSVRGFLLVAAGLRARSDSVLAMNLARYGGGGNRSRSEAAVLAYAFGASRNTMLMPELIRAAKHGELGGTKLSDIGRSHAAAGLALCGSPGAVQTLASVLRSRRAGLETHRGAALALGRLMREADLGKELFTAAQRALRQVLDKGRDKTLVAFAAIGLASASEPQAVTELIRLIDRSGNPIVKPYAALGLGLATARLEEKERKKVRSFLTEELLKTKEIDLSSALAVAVGLAGAQEAIPELLHRVKKGSLPGTVRGSAAQALGLIGRNTPEIEEALTDALRNGPPELIEGAAMGMGLLGYRGIAMELAQRLKSASSGVLQGKITIALGYLGQSTAVDPLLAILRDRSERRVIRELAAVALGLLGDPRDDDVLFELDAYFNFFATTPVTHELLTIF